MVQLDPYDLHAHQITLGWGDLLDLAHAYWVVDRRLGQRVTATSTRRDRDDVLGQCGREDRSRDWQATSRTSFSRSSAVSVLRDVHHTSNSRRSAACETGWPWGLALCRQAFREGVTRAPRLERLLGLPAGVHEVAILASGGPEELETFETGDLLDLSCSRGETLLEMLTHAFGYLDGIDLHHAHGSIPPRLDTSRSRYSLWPRSLHRRTGSVFPRDRRRPLVVARPPWRGGTTVDVAGRIVATHRQWFTFRGGAHHLL